MKRKNILSLVAVLLALVLTLAACGKETVSDAALQQQLAALQQENDRLKNEIEVLTQQLNAVQTAALKDWSLEATPLADYSGASISFTGVPATEEEGLTAALVIELNGYVAESVDCTLEGSTFTATVELPAMDGYGYYCLLVSSSGSQQKIPLVAPEVGGDQNLVNLGSGLNAYCNLFVDNWKYEKDQLTVISAFIQAQMPSLTVDGSSVTASEAILTFLHNGEALETKTVALTAGEGEGTYEAAVENAVFSVPKLEDDHQFDLSLEIKLSNGTTISFNGCSWFVTDGELNPVMG